MQGQLTTREAQAQAADLVDQLDGTRAGLRLFLQCRYFLYTALAVLALGGLLAAADWLWVLPTMVRAAGLLLLAALAAGLLVSGLVVAARRFGRREAAAEVEAAFPQLGQRVRTTLAYAEPDADPMQAAPGLIMALFQDTNRHTSALDFRGLIPWRSLRWLGAAVAGLTVLALVLLTIDPEARIAAGRLFLLSINYTQLEVEPGDQGIKVGSDLTVQATITGRPVSEANLRYRPAGSGADWTLLSFVTPEPEVRTTKLLGTLDATISDCQADLEYRVVAGSVASPIYHLTVFHPLVLKEFEANVEPPAYTRRPSTVVPEGNFQVIAGSRVRLRFTLDREPETASLTLSPSAGTMGLQIHGNELTGELASVDKDLEYELIAQAADGMGLEEVRRFRIQVQPDRKPTVRFLKPRDQIEVTPSTEVHMKVEAGDDFGLSAVGIVYQMGDSAKKTLFLKRDPAQPTAFKTEAVLPLEDLQVNFQDGITYYAFAEDNHPGRPQRTTTELQFIDIRPYKREYQLLKTGGS
jgi:hypothetical protein